MLVPGSDFKSDGSCGDATPAGSIPVRFRQSVLHGALCILAVVLLGAACAGTPEPGVRAVGETDAVRPPAWILGDCRTHWPVEARRVLCGVGSADGSENRALVRRTAVARARAALDTSLASAVQAMLLDYAETEPGRRDFNLSHDGEQQIARTARAVTESTLSEASVRESWLSSSDVEYALVALDADAFASAVRDMQELRPSLRQALIERAGAAFAAP